MNKVRVLEVESFLPTYVVEDQNIIAVNEGKEIEIDNFEVDLKGKLEEKEKEKLAMATRHNEEEGEPPSWVKSKIILGAFGEKIAVSFFQTLFNNVTLVADQAFKGYDIEIKDQNKIIGVEVKTSKRNETVHITYNELEKAYKMQENYYLFFIHVDEERKRIIGYLIKNVMDSLNIDFKILTRLVELENVYLLPSQFIIKFKPGFLEELDENELSQYS